ncbi:integrase [Nocardia wallacei]|uniref:integrase n=1 Tax=Nocardia wallacei TaxID=480035 RepID=UPI0024577598|nr:integrase [Nocardia wallacei]
MSPELAGSLHAHYNSRYADPAWSLAPLTDNPSARRETIRWERCPSESLREQLRLAAWTMINGRLRPSFLVDRSNTPMRSRLSAGSIKKVVRTWIDLTTWLTGQGISSLSDCTTDVLDIYAQHMLSTNGYRRANALTKFSDLTRLWAFDQLSGQPSGIGRPPWDIKGVDNYLPAATAPAGGENSTEPLSEQTMGPLLIWAMRMIDDLADDILAAYAEHRRLSEISRTTPLSPAGRAAVHAYLDPLIAAGAPLPATTCRGKPALARTCIAGTAGVSQQQIFEFSTRFDLGAMVAQRPGPCPLRTPISGRIAGKPWREAIDFTETPDLTRHLGTAAFIVCGFLTGMRPGELLGLRTGCCPDPVPGDTGAIGRHLIRGNEFKTAIDSDGNHASAGTERDVPWVAITPVVNAIRVLERMVPDGHLLFDHNAHDVHRRSLGAGALKHATLKSRVEDFVAWANSEAAQHHLPHEIIPDDPHGAIGTARFRRSLAWHIARRPNGLVALAIQYGHMRTLVAGAYASRARGGIHHLLDIETARAVADTVADLHAELATGAGISGPAARHAIRAAAATPRFAGTVITARTARKLLANEDVMLYDNPHAMLLCSYKRDRALCHRDGVKDTPRLDHCVPGCGNVVRTDGHAVLLRQRADNLDQQAAHVPGPLAERLRTNATRLRGYADTHDRTRITIDPDPETGERRKDSDESGS